MRLAVVAFEGALGGAEIVMANLATALRQQGEDVTVVFVVGASAMGPRLADRGVPFVELGMRRRHILYHPRRFASAVASVGDGAILVECGYLGGALRLGGFSGRIVGIEHGSLLELRNYPWHYRLWLHAARRFGAWADDVDVAVSQFMLDHLRRAPHAPSTLAIHNGLAPQTYAAAAGLPAGERGDDVVVGTAGRLVPGKGFDVLIQALAEVRTEVPVRLRLAGAGPELPRLQAIAATLGVGGAVEFLGPVQDMVGFWGACDMAVTPSDTFVESFSMTTLEAMASGRPLVVTRNGAIVELVVDGENATVVTPGDSHSMAAAIGRYARDPALRAAHGAAARRRSVEQFDLADSARRYRALFESDTVSPRRRGRRRRTQPAGPGR